MSRLHLLQFFPPVLVAAIGLIAPSAATAEELRQGGKLVLTNGISTLEGASGGGIASWAVIAGNETRDGIGAQASVTVTEQRDYDVRVLSAAIGFFDRVELSYARQNINTNEIGGALGIGKDFAFDQDVFGAKVRLFGDLVYGPEWLPAVAAGVQYKKNRDADIVRAVGAAHDEGVDVYASATKLLLRHSLLVNATLRLTKANQLGLLGFGGDLGDAHRVEVEASAAYQFSRPFAVGAEFRSKPDNLGIAREDDWFDVFAAYAINRHVTATVAYADLGSVATVRNQRGVLFQLQAGF
ncbi:DUF3034 family protein [Sphingomonas sp. SFZ2018-12]|uniref:DUF3034 family protein n=1 Tax=Sphingomonas sp. SFZ2018-12 TaxID=2683197 RepID=UPI001F102670|nr:DUF3034 family protein [Sphingomonas sp. SFZ2018-12]MCH4894636.1 DUF3034 family protein [Sphingomonas sp. SFZ2018-12]